MREKSEVVFNKVASGASVIRRMLRLMKKGRAYPKHLTPTGPPTGAYAKFATEPLNTKLLSPARRFDTPARRASMDALLEGRKFTGVSPALKHERPFSDFNRLNALPKPTKPDDHYILKGLRRLFGK